MMKYICTINSNGEFELFTFPSTVQHSAMAEGLARLKNQTYGDWKRITRTPVSAGFISPGGLCCGESFTLGLQAEEARDTALLKHQMLNV